jgi:hypothetical protein
MTFKSILILQAAGIGDILFCQKIASMLAQKYNKPIIWPVIKEILWVKDYLDTNPLLHFIEYTKDHEKFLQCKLPQIVDDILIVPICNADLQQFKAPIMMCKYMMCNLNHIGWETYINIKRNFEKEKQLFDMVVNNKDYIYVNKIYSTPPNQTESSFVKIDNNDKEYVYHQMIDGYNLFDWIAVAANAKEIHTVSTGNFYIYEALQIKFPSIHIYNRDDRHNLAQLGFLKPHLNKQWIFHEYDH